MSQYHQESWNWLSLFTRDHFDGMQYKELFSLHSTYKQHFQLSKP